MNKNNHTHRSAMTAIAAVLAFSSSNLFAQDASGAQPVAEMPVPVVEPLAPEPETPVISETTAEPASDPLAPAATASKKTKAAPTTPAARVTPRSTPSVARPARTPSAAAAPIVATAPVAPVEAAVPVAAPLAAPVPVAQEIAPVAPAPVESSTMAISDDVLPIAGAAGLGLLALLGAGAVVRRRKRNTADEYVADEWSEPAFVAPAPVARTATPTEQATKPAFGWPGAPVAAAAAAGPQGALPVGVDEASLGHHVAAAYRGPSADNPSLSLKKRIKRAAFFDQRERLARAGKAVAVAPGSGLPAAMAEQATRVGDAVTARTPRPMSYRPAFQPA
jgi:hypothetical protein